MSSFRKIEEKRGVTVTDSGTPEVKLSTTSANELRSEQIPKSNLQNSSAKNKPSWDEDWGPAKKASNVSPPVETNVQPELSLPISQQAPTADVPFQSLAPVSSQQQTSTVCTAVDIEWPPSNSYSGFGSQSSANENLNTAISNSSFDELDPFANWPPKPSNSASNFGSASLSAQSFGISGPSSSNNTSIGHSKPQIGSLISKANNRSGLPMSSQNFGQLNHVLSAPIVGNSVSASGASYANINSNATKTSDLGSIFAPMHNGQPTPRIAPPPATAIGRGRGRNQGNSGVSKSSRSRPVQASSEQPPLLDLL